MILPEVIIFSVQRSGSHLLLDLLESHPDINGRSNMFSRYRKGRKFPPHVEGKVNVAVLHYNNTVDLYNMGGSLENFKIIRLVRDPRNVAISQIQMDADKKLPDFSSGHLRRNNKYKVRGKVDETLIEEMISQVGREYKEQKKILKNIDHITINYEDFVNTEQSVEYMDEGVARKILDFIGLKYRDRLHTTFIKTGIYKN